MVIGCFFYIPINNPLALPMSRPILVNFKFLARFMFKFKSQTQQPYMDLDLATLHGNVKLNKSTWSYNHFKIKSNKSESFFKASSPRFK
jgi:hypothetical protein